MADLVAAYSKQTEQIKLVHKVTELAARTWPERPPRPPLVARDVNMRLSTADLAAMVQAYEAGATGGELATQYGVARSTVIQVLRQQGVQVRHARIGPEEKALAVELYQQGHRQVDIARELGRSKSHIWHLLKRAGVL